MLNEKHGTAALLGKLAAITEEVDENEGKTVKAVLNKILNIPRFHLVDNALFLMQHIQD